MGWRDIFKNKKSVPMAGTAKTAEIDAAGNWWYLSSMLGGIRANKTEIDMSSVTGKRNALLCCTPFSSVVDKAGMMMSRGVPYVVDKDGNERKNFGELRDFLMNPNPVQTFSSFMKQAEICLKVYGYCPIVLVRATRTAVPSAMWIVPPELFHVRGTGKLFRQFAAEDIIKRYFVSWGGRELDFNKDEVILVIDSEIAFPQSENQDVRFLSVTDSLSDCVTNWIASIKASHTLLVNGGPKGIVYNDFVDEMGNVALTAEDEKEIKDKFRERYGLVGKEYPVLVSRVKLGWIPLDYNSEQLKVYNEDARCVDKICNAIGINPNLFTDAKYDNQESAKKAAYQDVIIPDSKKFAEALSKALCPDGAFIRIDFSDVECLQANNKQQADTLNSVADAVVKLMGSMLITPDEARIEVARYMEIDPDKPIGEFLQPILNGVNKGE